MIIKPPNAVYPSINNEDLIPFVLLRNACLILNDG